MLAAALIVALAGGAFADVTGTLTVGDRNEARLRVYQGETEPGVDFATTPGLRLDLLGPRFSYSIGYFPSLTMEDIEMGASPQIMQTATTAVSWLASRRFRISIGEDGSYGTENYTYLNPAAATTPIPGQTAAPPASLQLLPGSENLYYGSSHSALTLWWRAAEHLQFNLLSSFFIGGGLDQASRDQIPMQRMPRVQLDTMVTLDRRDTLTTTIAGTDTWFSAAPCDPTTGSPPTLLSQQLYPNATCKPHNDLLELSESLRRKLSRTDDLLLSAGFSYAHALLDPGGIKNLYLPNSAATLIHHFHDDHNGGTKGELTLDARVGPVIDIRFGTIDERAQLRAACKWKGDKTTITIGVGGTQSLPPGEAGGVTFLGADGEVLYALGTDKRFDVGGGYRGAWQSEPPFSPFFSSVFYGVLVYHEPKLLLWP